MSPAPDDPQPGEANEKRNTDEMVTLIYEELRSLAAKINYPDADALVAHGAEALREMHELGILTGTRIPT